MADTPTPNAVTETQASRRLKYGLNVAVAALAAVALVVLLNWIAYRHYVRFDWTATRQYSLSQQTRTVLRSLEGDYRIVMIFRADQPELQRVRDRVTEYGRYAANLSVQYIDPDLEVARRDAFLGGLRERFTDELQPMVDAVAFGREALTSAAQALTRMVEPLREAVQHPDIAGGPLEERFGTLQTSISTLAGQLKRMEEGIAEAIDQPLPEYPAALGGLRERLDAVQEVLTQAGEHFGRLRTQQGVPTAVQDRLLGLAEEARRARDGVAGALEAIRGVPPAARYGQLVESIRSPSGALRDAVIAVGPNHVRVVDVNEMFRQPDPELARTGARAELQFVGEEKLTGALLSMSMDRPAMVVFIALGAQPALGAGGQYEHVASRLRAANFRVEQWQPGGRMGPGGQMMPPSPPPQAEEGQRTIWISTPAAMNPRNPMAMMAAGAGKAAAEREIRAGLARGDAAMLMFAPDTGAAIGEEDPLAALTGEWGLIPQLDRIVLYEMQLSDRRTQPAGRFRITQWEKALPITRALGGMQALMSLPTPLVMASKEGVKTWPLVTIQEQRMWAETGFGTMTSASELRYDEAEAMDRAVVGAAAEKGGARMLVTTAGGMGGDPNWAADGLTTLSTQGIPGEQFVELFGAAFPGNAELFVNGVYWLAGLDDMIAASPRSQDIRRIGDVTPTQLTIFRTMLLAGVPLAIVLTGVGVWLVRRKG